MVFVCLCLVSCQGHVFFTKSRYDVTISSVTSPGHVIDVYVYTAPSAVQRRDHNDDVIVCRLANVYRNNKKMKVAAWPFTLLPSNDVNNSSSNNNNTVSLYVKPRDIMSRDQGLMPPLVGYFSDGIKRATGTGGL